MKEKPFEEKYYRAPDTQKNLIEAQSALEEMEGMIREVRSDLKRLSAELESETAMQRKLMELDAVFVSMRDDVVDSKERISGGIPVVDEKPRQREIVSLRKKIDDSLDILQEMEEMKALQEEQMERLRSIEDQVERWVGKWPIIEA